MELKKHEEEIITSEIAHLLELGVIEPSVYTPDEYISTIFVRRKPHHKLGDLANAVVSCSLA